MIAEVEVKTVTSLPVQAIPTATDLILLVIAGIAKKAALGDVRLALDIATNIEKGLMSAGDKSNLTAVLASVAKVLSPPGVTIASSATIIIPPETYFVTITGTTTITAITGLVNNRPTYFYYPAGAGLVLLGESVKAGDPPYAVVGTA